MTMTIEATPIAIDDEDVVIATATATVVGTANNDIESREEGQISTIQVEAIPEAVADVNTDKHAGNHHADSPPHWWIMRHYSIF